MLYFIPPTEDDPAMIFVVEGNPTLEQVQRTTPNAYPLCDRDIAFHFCGTAQLLDPTKDY